MNNALTFLSLQNSIGSFTPKRVSALHQITARHVKLCFLIGVLLSGLGAIQGTAQVMEFQTGISEPGFTFSGWGYDAADEALYPLAPSVNDTMSVVYTGICFDLESFNPWCWSGNCPGGGGTWKAWSNQGDEAFFNINGNQVITLNWDNINALYLTLDEVGSGGINQTFNFDNVVYSISTNSPASMPSLVANNPTIISGEDATITVSGELNDNTHWQLYTGGCSENILDETTGNTFVVSPTTTTEYSVAGYDHNGCSSPGPCSSGLTIVVLQPGCTNPTACNFDSIADTDDGSCTFPGCTNPDACNYDSTVSCDNGTCTFPGCTIPDACNYDPNAGCDNGSCSLSPYYWYLPIDFTASDSEPAVYSCWWAPPGYEYASNQACVQSIVNGSSGCGNTDWDSTCDALYCACIGGGCTDPGACNYDSAALCDDGSCELSVAPVVFVIINQTAGGLFFDCSGGETARLYFNETGCGEFTLTVGGVPTAITSIDLDAADPYIEFIAPAILTNTSVVVSNNWGSAPPKNMVFLGAGCTDSTMCNYNPAAVCDDGSCSGFSGCTDPMAPNYDPSATCDDGSCLLDATTLNMDATSDHVVVQSDASTDFGTGDFTFEAWMMIDITGDAYEGMITSFNTFDAPSDNGGWAFHKNESSVRFLVGDSNANGEFEGVDYTIQTDTWYHYAGVRSNNTLYLYVDGVLVGSVASERDLPNLPIHFGKRYVNQSVQQGRGSVDEFRLWSKALTPVEINARMNCELHGDEADLVRYYKFNQGFDGADNSTETTLASDALNNPVDGTLVNFSLVGPSSNWIRGNELTAPCGSVIYGCTDSAASNYNDQANVDDGSCASDCLGDFDGDSFVNTSDLLLFLGDFGCVNTPCVGDLDGDGFTNTSDLLIFLSKFGADCL